MQRRILLALFLFCIPLSGLILSCGSDYFESGRAEFTIRYSRSGSLAEFNLPSYAKVYGSDGFLLAEAKVIDDEMTIPAEGMPAQIVLLETQYQGGRTGKVVYQGKIIFDTETGELLSKEVLQGKKRFEDVFTSWPVGIPDKTKRTRADR